MSKQNRNPASDLKSDQRCPVAVKNDWHCTETAVYAVPLCPLTKQPCINDLPLAEEDEEIWHPLLLGPLDIVDPNELKSKKRSVNNVQFCSAHSPKRVLVSAARNYLLANL